MHGVRGPITLAQLVAAGLDPSTGFVKPNLLIVSLVPRGALVYLVTYLGLRERTFRK